MYENMILAKQDSNPKIILGKYEVRKYQHYLYWIKTVIEPHNLTKNVILKWDEPWKKLTLPYNLGYLIQNPFGIQVPLPQSNQIINIKFYTSNKIFTPNSSKKKSLKQIYKYYKIPLWYRTKIPMLFYDDVFICIFGLFINPKIETNKKNISLSWIYFNKHSKNN